MKWTILLSTPCLLAQTLCEIEISTLFLEQNRHDLKVYLTNPHNDEINTFIGSLFSPLSVHQVDRVEPNTVIHHTYSIQSNQTGEYYLAHEKIFLRGCEVDHVDIQTQGIQFDFQYEDNSVNTQYKIMQKPQEPTETEESEKR